METTANEHYLLVEDELSTTFGNLTLVLMEQGEEDEPLILICKRSLPKDTFVPAILAALSKRDKGM